MNTLIGFVLSSLMLLITVPPLKAQFKADIKKKGENNFVLYNINASSNLDLYGSPANIRLTEIDSIHFYDHPGKKILSCLNNNHISFSLDNACSKLFNENGQALNYVVDTESDTIWCKTIKTNMDFDPIYKVTTKHLRVLTNNGIKLKLNIDSIKGFRIDDQWFEQLSYTSYPIGNEYTRNLDLKLILSGSHKLYIKFPHEVNSEKISSMVSSMIALTRNFDKSDFYILTREDSLFKYNFRKLKNGKSTYFNDNQLLTKDIQSGKYKNTFEDLWAIIRRYNLEYSQKDN